MISPSFARRNEYQVCPHFPHARFHNGLHHRSAQGLPHPPTFPSNSAFKHTHTSSPQHLTPSTSTKTNSTYHPLILKRRRRFCLSSSHLERYPRKSDKSSTAWRFSSFICTYRISRLCSNRGVGTFSHESYTMRRLNSLACLIRQCDVCPFDMTMVLFRAFINKSQSFPSETKLSHTERPQQRHIPETSDTTSNHGTNPRALLHTASILRQT